MRKLATLTAVLAAVAAAGCGGDGGSSSSPLGNALGYLPANTPFAVAIDTDPDGDQIDAAGDLADEFPGGEGKLRELIDEALGERADDLEEIEKALGNPFVVGSTDTREFLRSPGDQDESFVGAIQARDSGALDKLVEGDRAKRDGEVAGATIYEDDSGDAFAIDGDTLVVAGNREELEAALTVQEDGDGLSEDDFDAGTEGLPGDALLRVYLNVGEMLQASPDADRALKSKWVAALRTGGLALSLDDGEVVAQLNLGTDPEGLTDADLPLAAGSDSPEVLVRGGDVDLALRDPAQLLAFAQATAKAVDSGGFSDFERGKAQVESQLKIDLDEDVIGQLDGDLAVGVGLDGKFGVRAELADPDAMRATLKKLEPVLPDLAAGAAGERVGFSAPKAGEDFYAVATADGDQVVFGVVGDVLVVANDPALAGTVAERGTEAVPGAEGALVLRGDAERIGRTLLDQAAGSGFDLGERIRGTVATEPLAGVTGSFEVTTERLSGSFRIATDD